MPSRDQISRRRLTKAIAWTAPSAVVAIAAPAYATSLGETLSTPPDIGSTNLGMSGLLRVRKDCGSAAGKIDLDATLSSTYGFYVVGATKDQAPSKASFTCYFPTALGVISWTKSSGDSWTNLARDTSVTQYPGYYAYTSQYSGAWNYTGSQQRWDAATKPHWTSSSISYSALCARALTATSLRRVMVAGKELTIQRSVEL